MPNSDPGRSADISRADGVRRESLRIAGARVATGRSSEVFNPYTQAVVGTVAVAAVAEVRRAIGIARAFRSPLTRYQRYRICYQTAGALRARTEEIATLITAESGLCKKDSTYEVGRACDVFIFAGNAALQDDGQIFSCDLTAHGKRRKVYTLREPLLGVIAAITPFNHPLNQVAHKVAPSIASNNRMVLKPSEKTPLSALLLADILYEAGLPPEMFSVLTGDPRQIADELLTHADVDLITFTGGVAVGKYIAAKAVYKRQVLELGGNDPLIVMEDADLEEEATLAATGSHKKTTPRRPAPSSMATPWIQRPTWAPSSMRGRRARSRTKCTTPSRTAPGSCTATSAPAHSTPPRCSIVWTRRCLSSSRRPSGRCHPSCASRRLMMRSASRTPPPTDCPQRCAPTGWTTSRASCRS